MQPYRRQMLLFSHLDGTANREYEAVSIESTEQEKQGSDIVTSYLREIARFPLLSKDDEYEAARLAQNGDLKARDRIIHANLRLVARIARRYTKSGMAFLDLIEEGNMGLMHALEKFEPELGYRFSTYAAWWIQQNIERAIMNQGRIVRLPVHIHKQLNQCKRACNALSLDVDQNPSFGEIASFLGKDEKLVENVMVFQDSAISLDIPLDHDTDKTVVEVAPHDELLNPLLIVEKESQARELHSWLEKLSPEQYEVLIRRYGLCGFDVMTLNDVAQDLNMTLEKVRQIQLKAIKLINQHIDGDTRISKTKKPKTY